MIEYSLKKKLFFILILLLIAFFASLLLGELYIRLFKVYLTPETVREKSIQYEPSLFARYVFPLKDQSFDHHNNVKIYINDKGHRGKEFTEKKSKGVTRIIIFGGSAVFDPKVPGEKDWPHRVENIFKNKGVNNVEVINAGIPGHASWDSFGRLFAEDHIYCPDYVILCNAWNDIKGFSSKVNLLRSRKQSVNRVDPRKNYNGPIDQILCKSSQLYVRLRSRYYNRKFNIGFEGAISKGEYSNEITELALKQYRLNVEMFVDLARNIGAVPILMTQARLVTQKNTDKEKKRICYDHQKRNHQSLCEAFRKIDEIIMSVAKSKEVFMIDASKSLTGKVAFFEDHVHLSDDGSYNLASFTAKYLSNLIKEKNKK